MNYSIILGHIRRAEDELTNLREAVELMQQGAARDTEDNSREWANAGANGNYDYTGDNR